MKAVQDFNYKVALASGLKQLQAGKLRQSEEQFRYLVSKFPLADGGYRGLARVQVELEDRAAALTTLRDGAAVLARAGERGLAIDLLREATALDPLDLAAHRRLAAALALAGDVRASADEYLRFARAEMAAGARDRARLEVEYALETLGDIPDLRDVARSLDVPEPAAAPALPAQEDPRAALFQAVEPSPPAAPPAEAVAAVEPVASAEPPVEELPAPPDDSGDALALEERATALLAARDPAAGGVAMAAARALAREGKTSAASDLLLQLVASGIAVHEAQQELVEVAQRLGRADIAGERARLLGEVRRLHG